MTKRWSTGLLTLCCLALAGCTVTVQPRYLTVSELVGKGQSSPGSLLLEAVVTDTQPGNPMLVELSDLDGDQHVWVSGFSGSPSRGDEVWTEVLGPPVPNDAVGVVYRTAGSLPPLPVTRHVTPRSALAVLVGIIAATAVLIYILAGATGWARRSRARRCSGCGSAVAHDWLSCARCGRNLLPSAPAIAPLANLVPALAAPPQADPPARPTRMLPGDTST